MWPGRDHFSWPDQLYENEFTYNLIKIHRHRPQIEHILTDKGCLTILHAYHILLYWSHLYCRSFIRLNIRSAAYKCAQNIQPVRPPKHWHHFWSPWFHQTWAVTTPQTSNIFASRSRSKFHSRPAGRTSTSVAISKDGSLPLEASKVNFQTTCSIFSSCLASDLLCFRKSDTLRNIYRTCCPAWVKLFSWSCWISSAENHLTERSRVWLSSNLHPRMCSLPFSAIWSTAECLDRFRCSTKGAGFTPFSDLYKNNSTQETLQWMNMAHETTTVEKRPSGWIPFPTHRTNRTNGTKVWDSKPKIISNSCLVSSRSVLSWSSWSPPNSNVNRLRQPAQMVHVCVPSFSNSHDFQPTYPQCKNTVAVSTHVAPGLCSAQSIDDLTLQWLIILLTFLLEQVAPEQCQAGKREALPTNTNERNQEQPCSSKTKMWFEHDISSWCSDVVAWYSYILLQCRLQLYWSLGDVLEVKLSERVWKNNISQRFYGILCVPWQLLSVARSMNYSNRSRQTLVENFTSGPWKWIGFTLIFCSFPVFVWTFRSPFQLWTYDYITHHHTTSPGRCSFNANRPPRLADYKEGLPIDGHGCASCEKTWSARICADWQQLFWRASNIRCATQEYTSNNHNLMHQETHANNFACVWVSV